MWQKDNICNSNLQALCNSSPMPYMYHSSRSMQPQLQLAMNWFRLIQHLRSAPQLTPIATQISSAIPYLEKRSKHKPSKLFYQYNAKLTQFHDKISKSKSNQCRFVTTKDKTKTKPFCGNKFLTTFKITSDCHNRLSRIPNKIGPFECKLCGTLYNGAVQLANHRCPQILRIEHRCPDCHKIFNCPANLASHRRWHKPKAGDPFTDIDENDSRFCVKADNSFTSFNIESIINVKMSHVNSVESVKCKKDSVHTNTCHVCLKTFITSRDLENHMLDHLLDSCYH